MQGNAEFRALAGVLRFDLAFDALILAAFTEAGRRYSGKCGAEALVDVGALGLLRRRDR